MFFFRFYRWVYQPWYWSSIQKKNLFEVQRTWTQLWKTFHSWFSGWSVRSPISQTCLQDFRLAKKPCPKVLQLLWQSAGLLYFYLSSCLSQRTVIWRATWTLIERNRRHWRLFHPLAEKHCNLRTRVNTESCVISVLFIVKKRESTKRKENATTK